MNAFQSRNYELGREARRLGFSREACNLRTRDKLIARSFWMAGYHDEDMNLDARYQTVSEG